MYREENGNCSPVIDLRRVLESLAPVQSRMLREEIRVKMERATAGQLTYAEYNQGHPSDVEQMMCVRDVLELKLSSYPGDQGVELLFRFYFSEPDGEANVLLGLHMNFNSQGPSDWMSRVIMHARRRGGSIAGITYHPLGDPLLLSCRHVVDDTIAKGGRGMELNDVLGIDYDDPIQRNARVLVEADQRMVTRLVELRKAKRLSQADVASLMGVDPSAITRIESGDRDPHLSTLRRYALAIGAVVEHEVREFKAENAQANASLNASSNWPIRAWGDRLPTADLVRILYLHGLSRRLPGCHSVRGA